MNRRGILFASGPALLVVCMLLPGLPAADGTCGLSNELRTYPLHGGCGFAATSAPNLDGVRLALRNGLSGIPDGATTDQVRAALLRTYGSRVTENVTPMAYTFRWDPILQQWVLVCFSASTFEVDFGDEGSIVVESRDTRLVPASDSKFTEPSRRDTDRR